MSWTMGRTLQESVTCTHIWNCCWHKTIQILTMVWVNSDICSRSTYTWSSEVIKCEYKWNSSLLNVGHHHGSRQWYVLGMSQVTICLEQTKLNSKKKKSVVMDLYKPLYHIRLLFPKASKYIVERHWNNEKDWKLKKREKSVMEIIHIPSSKV